MVVLDGGLNYLWGGGRAALAPGGPVAGQGVDVTASSDAIDARRATANLSAYLGGGWISSDHMTATADFVGADDTTLGSMSIGPVTRADRNTATTLVRRARSAPVPARTRTIRVFLTATAATGVSGAMADNVELTVDVRPPSPGGVADPGPGTADPNATPRRFGTATKVTVKLARRRISARGPVSLLVTNANGFAVTGTLTGASVKGRRLVKLRATRFSAAAGAGTTARLALPTKLRRQLQRKRTLTVRISASVRDPAGNRRTVSRRVAVRLKAGRH